MPVNFNFNHAQTVMRIQGAAQRAVAITAQQVLADCNEYCPQDQEGLIDSANTHSDVENGNLVWSTPYARYLYHGLLMVDPATGSAYAREGQTKVLASPEVQLDFSKQPNTKAGSHWCERAAADHREEWDEIYRRAFEQEMNR